MNPPFISKSRYLSGLQCEKLLWHYYNARDLIPQVDDATQAIFDQGHLVGQCARQLFPGGIEVAGGIIAPWLVDKISRNEVKLRKPLFEAGFLFQGAFARADILNPVGPDKWDIIEVKSSTEVKEINLHDLSLQLFVYEGAGLNIRHCILLHINRDYVRHGPIDPERLFSPEDITKQVRDLLPGVGGRLEKLKKMIGRKCPEIPIGARCDDPYPCPLHEYCWDFLPKHHVLTLNHIRSDRGFELIENGIRDIREIPPEFPLSGNQTIQLRSVKSGKAHIDREAIRDFTEKLKYPLSFLDFETFQTAIPLFDGTRPYQMIPFQYSLHRQERPGGRLEHFEHLSDGSEDPRRRILQNLKSLLKADGSIIAYNAVFERGVLRQLSESFDGYRRWFDGLEPRIVDLLVPFRSFAYYHPSQVGSASIKAVLPALVGESYEGLEISEGEMASREFLRVTFGEDVEEKERSTVRKQLLKYCRQDTMGMVKIVSKLERFVK